MNRTTKPVPKQLVRSAWRIGFSETTAEHAENPVYQEEYAAQLIMARRADLHPKGRIHLRRPVDRPSLFPCSHAADHTFRGSCDTPSPALTFTDGTRRRRDCPPHRRAVRYNYRRRRSRRCPYRGDFYNLICRKMSVTPLQSPVTSEELPTITHKEKKFLLLSKHTPLPAPPEVLPWSPQSVWDALVAVFVDQQGLKRKEILYGARIAQDLGVD